MPIAIPLRINKLVGFGMTKAIIYHACATQVGLKSPWTKIDKMYKDDRFKVEIISTKTKF